MDYLHVIHIVQDNIHQFLSTMEIERLYQAVHHVLSTTPTYRRRVQVFLSRIETGILYHQKRRENRNVMVIRMRSAETHKMNKLCAIKKKAAGHEMGSIGLFQWIREEFV